MIVWPGRLTLPEGPEAVERLLKHVREMALDADARSLSTAKSAGRDPPFPRPDRRQGTRSTSP